MRPPSKAPKWLDELKLPEEHGGFPEAFRKVRGGVCREGFVGTGRLSRALATRGCWVEPVLEISDGEGGKRVVRDLDRVEVRQALAAEIRSGFVRYMHWGLVCKGWASANNLNGGTRCNARLDGSEARLPR